MIQKWRLFTTIGRNGYYFWCMSMPKFPLSLTQGSVLLLLNLEAKKYYTNIYKFEYTLVRKRTKKICGLCWDNTQEKLEHIKRSHRREASEQFASLYNVEMNKTCKVCQNTRPFKGSIKLHGSWKHLDRAAKDFAHTFRLW